MLSSNFDPAMTQAVLRMVPVIQRKIPDIFIFIDAQTFLSDTKKTFYKTILQARLNFLLKPAYGSCNSGNYSKAGYERLQTDSNYTEADFERDYNNVKNTPS